MAGEAVRINGKLVELQLQLLCLQRGETHISTHHSTQKEDAHVLRGGYGQGCWSQLWWECPSFVGFRQSGLRCSVQRPCADVTCESRGKHELFKVAGTHFYWHRPAPKEGIMAQ